MVNSDDDKKFMLPINQADSAEIKPFQAEGILYREFNWDAIKDDTPILNYLLKEEHYTKLNSNQRELVKGSKYVKDKLKSDPEFKKTLKELDNKIVKEEGKSTIKDLKNSFKDNWGWWLVIGLVILALIIVIVWWVRKGKSNYQEPGTMGVDYLTVPAGYPTG